MSVKHKVHPNKLNSVYSTSLPFSPPLYQTYALAEGEIAFLCQRSLAVDLFGMPAIGVACFSLVAYVMVPSGSLFSTVLLVAGSLSLLVSVVAIICAGRKRKIVFAAEQVVSRTVWFGLFVHTRILYGEIWAGPSEAFGYIVTQPVCLGLLEDEAECWGLFFISDQACVPLAVDIDFGVFSDYVNQLKELGLPIRVDDSVSVIMKYCTLIRK